MNEGLPTLFTHMGCFSIVNFSVVNKSRFLLGHISTWQATHGLLFSVSHLFVKQRKGAQEGSPIVTATEKHQCILIPVEFPEVGAGWERLREPGPLAWTRLTVKGLELEEARVVQQVHSAFPARKGSAQRVDGKALHQ